MILTLRFWLGYGESFGQATWFAVRNAVGAFNNGGFNWRSDGLLPYVDDPLVCLPIAVGFIAGGLGFPVLIELRREIRPRAWSLHTKLTLTMTGALLILGPSAVTAFEWTNPRTLGPLDVAAKLLAGFFQGVTPRTAGFVTLDYAAMEETTWLATDVRCSSVGVARVPPVASR